MKRTALGKSDEEFAGLLTEALSGEHWVVASNYSVVRDLVWSRATTVVWLNYSLPVVFFRTKNWMIT